MTESYCSKSCCLLSPCCGSSWHPVCVRENQQLAKLLAGGGVAGESLRQSGTVTDTLILHMRSAAPDEHWRWIEGLLHCVVHIQSRCCVCTHRCWHCSTVHVSHMCYTCIDACLQHASSCLACTLRSVVANRWETNTRFLAESQTLPCSRRLSN